MPGATLAAESATTSPASIAGLVVSLGILGFILFRQRQARPLRTALVLPVVLVVAGLSSLMSATRSRPMTSGEIGVLIAVLAGDGVMLGALRACTVRLWREGGVIVRQGSWLTVALWLAGVAVHEVVVAAAHVSSASLVLYLGLTLAAQRFVLHARARRPGVVSRPAPPPGPGASPSPGAAAWPTHRRPPA